MPFPTQIVYDSILLARRHLMCNENSINVVVLAVIRDRQLNNAVKRDSLQVQAPVRFFVNERRSCF